jgi:hypothetical protein
MPEKESYKDVVNRQKKSITFYAILCVVFGGLIVAYSYFKWVDYSLYKEAVAANEANVEILKSKKISESSNYQNQKAVFDELTDEIDSSLKEVFPAQNNYTELTRSFDQFENATDSKNNPFLISNIEYQDIQITEDEAYKYLPVRMTISSSEENFTKFLQYIEKSGSLVDEVRLMDIESIHMSFSENEETTNNTINFSVKINAYYQNI